MNSTEDNRGKGLAVWGTILQSGFLIGLIGTMIGMINAFAVLGANLPEQDKGQALANSISFALWTTVGGMIISLVGTILLLIALWGMKYRALWFRNVLWVLSILWVISPPIGTVLGVLIIIYLATHNNEFAEQRPHLSPAGTDT